MEKKIFTNEEQKTNERDLRKETQQDESKEAEYSLTFKIKEALKSMKERLSSLLGKEKGKVAFSQKQENIPAETKESHLENQKISPEESETDIVSELAENRYLVDSTEGRVLAEDSIRKTLKDQGILSESAYESLQAAVQKYNAGDSTMTNLKENRNYNDYTKEHPLGGMKEISNEEANIELGALTSQKDVIDGWVSIPAFKESLGNEIENVKLKKVNEKLGKEISSEELKPGFESLKESADNYKYDTFTRLIGIDNEDIIKKIGKDYSQIESAWRNFQEWKKQNPDDESNIRPYYDKIKGQALDSVLRDFKYKVNRQWSDDMITAERNIVFAEMYNYAEPGSANEAHRIINNKVAK